MRTSDKITLEMSRSFVEGCLHFGLLALEVVDCSEKNLSTSLEEMPYRREQTYMASDFDVLQLRWFIIHITVSLVDLALVSLVKQNDDSAAESFANF